MKEWAIKAELIDRNIENQLKIVFEPDCASLAIQHKIARAKKKSGGNVANGNKNGGLEDQGQSSKSIAELAKAGGDESHFADYSFTKGQKYILIDAGGGTVDIAFHEILGDFGVKECHHPSGGPWGSCYIDDEFIRLLDKIFGKENMDKFKASSPSDYTQILMNFRSSKNSFTPNVDKHNVTLTYDFFSFLEEAFNIDEDEDDLHEKLMENIKELYPNNEIKIEEDTLMIDVKLWIEMFDVCVNPIIKHCKDLCKDKRLLKNTKYVCLVGGLSSSEYFRARIDEEFGLNSSYKFTLIKPERPMLTVVEGAALFGITDNYIQARVLSKTYGVEGALFLDEAKSIKIPDSHIEAHKLYHPHHEKWRVTGIFCPIATKNDTIYTKQVIQRTTTRAHQNDSYVSVTIWCSTQKHPILTPTCQHLASMIIKFDGTDAKDSDLEIEFHFYDTLLRVFAYPKTQPHHKKEVELQYTTNYD